MDEPIINAPDWLTDVHTEWCERYLRMNRLIEQTADLLTAIINGGEDG